MIVVDSSVWVDFFNGVESPQVVRLDQALSNEPVILGDLVMTEVLQGFRSDVEFRKAMALLALLDFRPMVGHEVALAAAQNFRLLRRHGVTVRKTIDVLIGTFCILEGLPLLHSDRDFEPMVRHLGLTAVPS